MNCVICGQAAPEPGTATVTLEQGDAILVLRRVPALICPNCGEEFVSDDVATRVQELANGIARTGTTVEVKDFAG